MYSLGVIWPKADTIATLTVEEAFALPPAERLFKFGSIILHMPDAYEERFRPGQGDGGRHIRKSIIHAARPSVQLFAEGFVSNHSPPHGDTMPQVACGYTNQFGENSYIGLYDDKLAETMLDLPFDRIVLEAFDEHFATLES